LVIDGHPTIRLGVRGLLEDRFEVEEVPDGRAAIELLTTLNDFDVAIVELTQTQRSDRRAGGLHTIRALRKARPALGIVAHATRPDHHAAAEAMSSGAIAYVAKNSPCEALEAAVDAAAEAEEWIDPAVRSPRNGNGNLTRRQTEILQLCADGCSTEDVAKKLDRSTETVRTHIKAVLSRLEARDRAHAVAIGLRTSLIE
jgi:DNA-binding NarL/FixJ family response regulator